MKAPDKIYIQTDMINNIPLEQQEFDDDVVYIRKDALLEWAEERLVKSYDGSTDFDYGMAYAYTCLIEKLEEL